MLIAISGKKGSGKTHAAKLIQQAFGGEILSFATPVKQIVSFLSEGRISELVSKTDVSFGHTHGELLQLVGQGLRKIVDEGIWSSILEKKARKLLAEGTNVIIDDLRYRNELEMIRGLGAKTIRFHGVFNSANQDDRRDDVHQSEVDLDGVDDWDLVLDHSSGSKEFGSEILSVVKTWTTVI